MESNIRHSCGTDILHSCGRYTSFLRGRYNVIPAAAKQSRESFYSPIAGKDSRSKFGNDRRIVVGTGMTEYGASLLHEVRQSISDSRSKFGNDSMGLSLLGETSTRHCREKHLHVIAGRSPAICCVCQLETDSRSKFGNDKIWCVIAARSAAIYIRFPKQVRE